MPQPDASRGASVRALCYAFGCLVLLEAMMLWLCSAVAAYYGEGDALCFLLTAAPCTAAGLILLAYSGRRRGLPTRRDAYLVVGCTWILFTLVGMCPLLIGHYVTGVTDAFFEIMSGFTTTGFTILPHTDGLPHGILFWRSLTQWVGGLGIVFLTLALLPAQGSSGQRLYLSEATGVTHDKLFPKVSVMARTLWLVYVGITLAEVCLLMVGGVNMFDAVCHAFATTATGGFSTHDAGVLYWHSPFVEYVIAVFMLLSGINFTLYFLSLRGRLRQSWRDGELRWFLSSILVLTLFIALVLWRQTPMNFEEAFRKSLFQVATCHTSTGFASADYTLWPTYVQLLLLFAMLSGGCTGSTSGGIKCARLGVLWQAMRHQLRRLLHPHAECPVRMGLHMLSTSQVNGVLLFVITYLCIVFIATFVLLACGMGVVEAVSTTISSMGNVGVAMGTCGPDYSLATLPDVAKWTLSALMLLGRLEIFGLLLIVYRPTWKNGWTW